MCAEIIFATRIYWIAKGHHRIFHGSVWVVMGSFQNCSNLLMGRPLSLRTVLELIGSVQDCIIFELGRSLFIFILMWCHVRTNAGTKTNGTKVYAQKSFQSSDGIFGNFTEHFTSVHRSQS